MSKHFYTHIDLRFNQLLKVILEKVDGTTILTGTSGRVFWCTSQDRPAYWTGSEVRYFTFNGEAIPAANITQSTLQRFVSQADIDSWNDVSSMAGDYQLKVEKNAAYGYAGLDANGKLDISTLWSGMVIEYPVGSGVWKTMGELFDQAGGIPQLDENGQLDAMVLRQTGYTAAEQALLVSQNEKNVWNALSGEIAGTELIVNKGQVDGYTPLNSLARVPKEHLSEGTVLRRVKKQVYTFIGTIVEGEEIAYTLNEEASVFFTAGPTTTLANMVQNMATSINGRPDLTASFTSTTITVTAVAAGYDFDLVFSYLNQTTGTVSISSELEGAAFYDFLNLAGYPTVGYAPLNNFGVIDNTYLPSYKDIKVYDTYGDMQLEPAPFNGLRAHVIDASADTTVETGWAEYIWLEGISDWQKTSERETAIDITHNSTAGVQGDGATLDPKQLNHLTDAQYQRVKDSESKLKFMHLNAQPGVVLSSFSKATFRAARVNISLEDHIGQSTLFLEINVLYDGNYPTSVEYGYLNSPMLYDFKFFLQHDINNIYLMTQSDSYDFSCVMRIKEFEKISEIQPILSPANDLYPSDGLVPV